ncbi:MAG: hypothetical protein ACRCW2_04830 [Cellulosilyticaceae bacterium]
MKNKKFLVMLLVGVMGFTGVQATIAETVTQDNSESGLFGKGNARIVIDAETDFDKDHEIPIIARVGQELGIHLNQEGYKLSVVGENGYKVNKKEFEKHNKNHKKGNDKACKKCSDEKVKYYTWTPTEPGIFTLQVSQGNDNGNKVVASRKIYINDDGMTTGKYHQLKGAGFRINEKFIPLEQPIGRDEVTTGSAYHIAFEDELTTPSAYAVRREEDVIFGTQIYRTSSTTPQVEFTIGEDMFWKRTLRSHSGAVNGNTYYIKEGEHFRLDKGTYSFWASMKGEYSVESEDFMKKYYTRTDEAHQVTLDLVEEDGELVASADCSSEEGCVFEYAFLVNDAMSSKVVSGYSQIKNYYTPTINPWQQTVEVRAKHVQFNPEDKLPNAYEARVFKTIGEDTYAEMIEEVEIVASSVTDHYNGKKAKKEEQEVKFRNGQPDRIPYVLANNKNYIEVEIDEDEKRHKDEGYTYAYRAWVVDDGVTIPLKSYYDDDQDEVKFVYYPKSGGNFQGMDAKLAEEEQKLIIEVEKFSSGGVPIAKEQRELTLEVRTTK